MTRDLTAPAEFLVPVRDDLHCTRNGQPGRRREARGTWGKTVLDNGFGCSGAADPSRARFMHIHDDRIAISSRSIPSTDQA